MTNVTKHSLGIASGTGKTIVVVPKDTPLPVQRTLTVTTAGDKQRNIGLVVVMGERPQAEDNYQLSRIRLDDIEPGLRGEATVKLTFRGFANGLWSVGIRYRANLPEQHLSIIPSAGFSKTELGIIQEKAAKYIEDNILEEEAPPVTEDIIPLPAI